MGKTTHTVEKHRQGYDRIETYIDGDLYKIVEEYKDDEGNVVYIYEYYPTTGELLKNQKRKNQKRKNNDKHKKNKKKYRK